MVMKEKETSIEEKIIRKNHLLILIIGIKIIFFLANMEKILVYLGEDFLIEMILMVATIPK